MKKHTSANLEKTYRANLHKISSSLLTLEAVLIETCFVLAIFCIGITVARNSNLQIKAAQPQTVTWNSVKYRHTVCLKLYDGTTACQPFRETTDTSADWTLASLLNYDFHVDISSNGSDWYGWDNQTNKGLDCYGPDTCSYNFTWPKVDYKVSTTLDGNQEHIVVHPSVSYTYADVGYGISYTGTVKFNDLGNFGNSHELTSLSGTTASQQWTLSAPAKNTGDVLFVFSPPIGTGASLIIRNTTTNAVVKDSGALVSGSSGYVWGNAPVGNYKAVLFYYPKAISNEIPVRIDRRAVMEKVEPRCGTTGYPRNVITRHQWKSAQGTFSSQVLQISTNSTFSSNFQEKSISASTTTADISGYESLKSYYSRVKSVTNDGRTIYSHTQGFSTIDCPNTGLDVPLPTSVSGLPACVSSGNTYGSGITLNWNTVSGATNYTARLTKGWRDHGDFVTKTVTGNSAPGGGGWSNGGNALATWVNSGNLALQPSVTYFFAVSASNGSINSGYDLNGKSLQIGPVPACSAAVVPPTPTGVSGVPICVQSGAKYGTNLTFKWTAVVGATSYTVRLAHLSNTSGDYSIKTVNTTSANGDGGWNPGGNPLVTWVTSGNLTMKAGTKYFYAVKAVGSGFDTGYDLVGKSMQVGPVINCIGQGADTDADGFSDSVESYIGTNMNLKCGLNAWPPDINNDGEVSSADQGLVASKVTSREGEAKYNRRMDINADKVINVADQAILASFVGKKCNVLGINTGEVKAAVIPSNMRTSTPPFVPGFCSDSITHIYAAWDGVGDYWVDFTWDNWQSMVHKEVKNAWVTGIPGGYTFSNGNDASWYVLFPGREYRWRLYDPIANKHYPDANGMSFIVPTCTSGVPAESVEIHDYILDLGKGVFMDLPPGNGSKSLASVELSRFLWGLAGCESGWNQKNDSNPVFKGLYQFHPDTWWGIDTNGDGVRDSGGILRALGEPTNTSIFDGFAQTRAVIHNINVSRVADPWNTATGRLHMFSTQWPQCSFIWNNAEDMAGY